MTDRFAGKSDWFDDHYRTTTRGRVRMQLVLDRLESRLPPPPARILDAGGGTGAFTIPLAARGHDVTLIDASDEWLELAGRRAAEAGVHLRLDKARLEDLPTDIGPFDVILCHAVLMYVERPGVTLRALNAAARPGALLSLLEKNRDALALRPGLAGDYDEARRLLDARDSIGHLSVENRAYSIDEWVAMLDEAGWATTDWAGVRLFSDGAPDDIDAGAYETLVDIERQAGTREPYRRLARLVHFVARRTT